MSRDNKTLNFISCFLHAIYHINETLNIRKKVYKCKGFIASLQSQKLYFAISKMLFRKFKNITLQ